jgi:hypothetical protein
MANEVVMNTNGILRMNKDDDFIAAGNFFLNMARY